MTIDSNCPHLHGSFGDEFTEIGTGPESAARFSAALSGNEDDLAGFVAVLMDQPRDSWVERYAAARVDLVPALLGLCRSVAEGNTRLALTITDDGPDMAVRRQPDGVTDLSILALPN